LLGNLKVFSKRTARLFFGKKSISITDCLGFFKRTGTETGSGKDNPPASCSLRNANREKCHDFRRPLPRRQFPWPGTETVPEPAGETPALHTFFVCRKINGKRTENRIKKRVFIGKFEKTARVMETNEVGTVAATASDIEHWKATLDGYSIQRGRR
jgi:hypothetical protein